jgi:alkylhydroperoxidase/carboxymuconolactone decarboxylase family protein YurZ
MQEDPKEREIADKILKAIERQFGFIPVVNQVLSERPDMFIPAANFGKAVLEGKGELDQKTRYLAAVSAAAALGGQHCVRVQMSHAVQAGATKDEILECLVIGSYMAMTHSQSYSFREYAEMFQSDKENDSR